MRAATAWQRLTRVVGTGSPAVALRAARREVWLRGERRRLQAALRSDRPLIVGPFLGEVGFELLYWRPYVRRLLRASGVPRERVVVVSRGGAGAWYEDVAATSIDTLEVISIDDLRLGVEARFARTGQRKQVDVDDLDRRVISAVEERVGPAVLLHPLHMYWSFRFVWEGVRPPEDALQLGDYAPLPRLDVPPAVAAELPPRFVALKLYANDCLPDAPEMAGRVRPAVAEIAAELPVVVLETGLALDDHDELEAGGPVVSLRGRFDAAHNLAQQAAVVARADALVSTYGGFSYLGPLLGVPTVAVSERAEWNPLHERVLHAAVPGVAYVRTGLAELPRRVHDALPERSPA